MAESIFLKTVLYGGYDKDDVIKKINELNLQLSEAKNKLSEMQLQLEVCKKGEPVDYAYESALSKERAELSQVQAQNETYEVLISGYKDEIGKKDSEIESLKSSNQSLKDEVADTTAKLTALQSGDDTEVSFIFVEAQKSAKALKTAVEAEVEKIKSESVKIAEDVIAKANSEAAQIVYDAEKKAAETIANAKNNSEQMRVADNNMRATMLENVNALHVRVTNMKSAIEAFSRNGLEELRKITEVVDYTDSSLKSGGVPKYKQPKTYNAELPQEPEQAKNNRSEENKEELGKLEKMAAALNGEKSKPKGRASLDDLQKMANSIDSGSKSSKSGSIDLNELQKQANSISGK
ncbi:MAG: hypothetical protein IJ736_12405 [Firmicutes bacterium]|nr:hypothetical protein [Bacillota bacterium]